MPLSNICWGIEIGAGAIKAVKLEASGGNVTVLDFAVMPHKKVLSTPDLDQNDALRVALGAFASQYDLSGAGVAISVPGHSAFARFAKLPPVEPKKIPDIVKFEAVQQIPFPIDEVEWDYQTFASPGTPDVEVGIFAITRERIMERLALYTDVNMTPDLVTLSPVAAYNALAYDLAFTEKTEGTIVLDIGTTSTDLVVAEAGRVWIRTFPIGGHHFTDALVNQFQLSYPKAEKLKREAENAKHARQIFQAMRPVFGDLAQDVQRSIGYYTSLHKDAKLTRLIGLGSTFRLPGLRKYLRQQLGVDVYRMEQFKRLSIDGPRAGEFLAATLNLATAYGLALQGLKGEGGRSLAALEANLMPVGVIREAMWKKKVKWFGLAACVAVAAGGVMFVRGFLDSQAIAANPRPSVVAEVLSTGKQLKSEANDVTSPFVPNPTAAMVLSLPQGRDVYAHIVDDLGQMLETAQAKLKDWGKPAAGATGTPPPPPVEDVAFTVKKLTTTYVPPPTANVDTFHLPGPDEAAGSADGAPVQPRIRLQLTVSTAQPDPQRFMLATLDKWLQDHTVRDGVPYKIIPGSAKLTKIDTVEAPVNNRLASGPASGGDSGEGGRSGRRPTRGGGEPGAGFERMPDQIADPGRIMVTGEAPSRDTQNAGQAQAANDVRRLAPIKDSPPLLYPPGTKIATFEITWDAELTPLVKKTEEGEPK